MDWLLESVWYTICLEADEGAWVTLTFSLTCAAGAAPDETAGATVLSVTTGAFAGAFTGT